MRVGGFGLHVCQINDGAIIVYERGGQSHQSVFHPKALNLWLFKHKQHPLVLRHVLAVHQPDGALLWGRCDLRIYLVNASLQCHTRKMGLRGLGSSISAKQKKEEARTV